MSGAPRSPRWPTFLLAATALLLCGWILGRVYLSLLEKVRAEAPPPESFSPSIPTPSAGRSGPRCPPARLGVSNLGDVAWTSRGQLIVYSLADCRQKVIVPAGASAPVRFSPDGNWIAFGEGYVVPATGGVPNPVLGADIASWTWSPTDEVLAGVTSGGALIVGGTGDRPRSLVRSGVGHAAFSPDGDRIAIDRRGIGVQVIDVATGKARTVLPVSSARSTPSVAGWSPDGKWVIYWRGPVAKSGTPMDAVPVSGGAWVNLYEPVLPHPDSFVACGEGLAISVGPGGQLNSDKQIVTTFPPAWDYRNLSNDFSRSWFWPACSPDGRWVAATDSLNKSGAGGAAEPRALWLFASDGSYRSLLVPGTGAAVEFPRWSADGSVILAVLRSGGSWSSPGRLLLVRIDPRSGKEMKVVAPFAELGPAPGPGGDERWWAISDWYQPG